MRSMPTQQQYATMLADLAAPLQFPKGVVDTTVLLFRLTLLSAFSSSLLVQSNETTEPGG